MCIKIKTRAINVDRRFSRTSVQSLGWKNGLSAEFFPSADSQCLRLDFLFTRQLYSVRTNTNAFKRPIEDQY